MDTHLLLLWCDNTAPHTHAHRSLFLYHSQQQCVWRCNSQNWIQNNLLNIINLQICTDETVVQILLSELQRIWSLVKQQCVNLYNTLTMYETPNYSSVSLLINIITSPEVLKRQTKLLFKHYDSVLTSNRTHHTYVTIKPIKTLINLVSENPAVVIYIYHTQTTHQSQLYYLPHPESTIHHDTFCLA